MSVKATEQKHPCIIRQNESVTKESHGLLNTSQTLYILLITVIIFLFHLYSTYESTYCTYNDSY